MQGKVGIVKTKKRQTLTTRKWPGVTFRLVLDDADIKMVSRGLSPTSVSLARSGIDPM